MVNDELRRQLQWWKLIKSFAYAMRGLRVILSTQRNAWIHLVATLAVIVLALLLQVSWADWRWLVVSIGAVWTAELFNTALERLSDAITKEPHPMIGDAKDLSAGAVLIASITAALIGASVFIPHLMH